MCTGGNLVVRKNSVVLWKKIVGWKIWILSAILQWEKNQLYKNSSYVGTGTLLRNRIKSMSIQRRDKKIKLSWRLENSNRYQIERLVHISNTIIIIAFFTKSLETITLMYSREIDDNDSRDKTTTSRARYSRNKPSKEWQAKPGILKPHRTYNVSLTQHRHMCKQIPTELKKPLPQTIFTTRNKFQGCRHQQAFPYTIPMTTEKSHAPCNYRHQFQGCPQILLESNPLAHPLLQPSPNQAANPPH
jgi:hypothetical protein